MPMLEQIAATFEDSPSDWPQDALAELHANALNGHVGRSLLSETDRVRVWAIKLAPGKRHRFHPHVLDYFWTALNSGRARSRYGDGAVRLFEYSAGETMHLHYGAGEPMIHDLTNVGASEIFS